MSILLSRESFADSLLLLKPILLHVYCTVEDSLGGPRLRRTLFNETTMCVSVAASGGGLTIGDSFLTLPLVRLGELTVPFSTGVVSAQTYSLFSSDNVGRSTAAHRFEQWLRSCVLKYQSTVLEQLVLRGIRVVERPFTD